MTFTKEHKTHHLKIYPEHFSAVLTGVKRAELRKNDRDFKVGDTLHLMETPKESCKATGEFVNAVITHVADVGDWFPGHVLLSIEREMVRTAPPAPVSMKDHQIRELVNELRDIAVEYHGTQQLRERIARTVRAAMLQSAEPVTTANKLRDAVYAIRNSGIAIDGEKIKAERDALNSPVIPDGWVACSERMPEEDGNYWGWWSESKRQGPVWFIKSDLQAQFQSSEITHWMPLPAAPQQEVKSGR